jgi:lipoprotein NlpI
MVTDSFWLKFSILLAFTLPLINCSEGRAMTSQWQDSQPHSQLIMAQVVADPSPATSPSEAAGAAASTIDRARLWLARGQALYGIGQYTATLSATQEVLAMQPENIAAWELQGNALQKMERYEEALAAYDQALVLSGVTLQTLPENRSSSSDLAIANLWAERARILANMNRYQESVTSYDRALQLQCQQRTASGSPLPPACQMEAIDEATPTQIPAASPDNSAPTVLW